MKTEKDEIDTPERIAQLEKIDELRELGVGDEINLPQIIFRRSASYDAKRTVSIIPAASADEAHRAELQKFSKELSELTPGAFSNTINEAAKAMGLPSDGGDGSTDWENVDKRFSDDVLKIELSGPSERQMSFVDVPGLFHNPTKYQTLEDATVIRRLIQSYVGDSRTIIMAVMDARNNLANQEVFRIARAADPNGYRTVGVMTKCDALQDGDEPTALKIAKNEAEPLTHGWFCVRNRSTQEIQNGITIRDRHRLETEFFKRKPWDSLDRQRVGITPLKRFIGRLLSDHVANVFPDIRREIETKRISLQNELTSLGSPRQTSQEQMRYLLDVAEKYKNKTRDSLLGRYHASGLHPSKLRMHVKMANDAFAERMHAEGHANNFEEAAADPNTSKTATEDGSAESKIYEWIRGLYRTSRGTELPGHCNPSMLESLFSEQTQNWVTVAEEHLDTVIDLIRKCVESLLSDSCPDDLSRDKVRRLLDPEIELAIQKARDELQRILQDEREPPLDTTNSQYNANLRTSRTERIIVRLKSCGFTDGSKYTMDFRQLSSVMHLSNEDAAVHDTHDTLKAYYSVALDRFIDNVGAQVVERNLLGPQGPVNLFSPQYVGGMAGEDLEAVAAEDFATSAARERLRHQIGRMERARKICGGAGGLASSGAGYHA
ncbi:MAG: hypothetical protein M1817_002293 [Caeruleum heppii]|nr:MAG: hypothetical protein M1817_002293 [Caeruleum heppii]